MVKALLILVALLAVVIGVFLLLAAYGSRLQRRDGNEPVSDRERADLLQARLDRLTATGVNDQPASDEADQFEQMITARIEAAMAEAFEQGAAYARSGTLPSPATLPVVEQCRLPVEGDEPTEQVSLVDDPFADLRDENGIVPASIAIARLRGEHVRRREPEVQQLPVTDLDDVSIRWLECDPLR